MKYIDLDQPSRNSARADSANGAIESAGPVQLESPDNGLDSIPLFSRLAEQGDKGTDDTAAPAGSIGARLNDQPQGKPSPANNPNSEFRRPNTRPAENVVQAKSAKEPMGSTATERQTRALDHKSREIVAHEGKHAAILQDNRVSGAEAKPQLLERQGPDGRKYAAAGAVSADLAPIPGNPHLTEQKAEAVYRSAMSDSERSPSDESAAQQAMFVAQESRQEKLAGDPSQATINVNTPAMGQMPQQQERQYSRSAESQREPMQSPHNVTMHNPAVALAPLVVGGVARAAGMAAAGGAARAAGGAVAGGLAPLTPVAGGAGAGAAQNFAPFVDQAGRSIQHLTRSTEDLDGRFVDMSEKLKIYSPELSLQKAINNIDRLNQAIEQGQRLGKPLAEFEKQKGRLDIAGGNIQADFVAVFLPIANEILRYIADVAAGVAVISSRLVPFFEKVLPPLLDFLSGVMNVIPGVLEMKLLLQWLVTLGEQEAKNRQQKANVQNLNDFFGMQVPGPRTAPDIRGPRMNMPLPQFNPLPFQPAPAGP